jgi:hypothetical protein
MVKKEVGGWFEFTLGKELLFALTPGIIVTAVILLYQLGRDFKVFRLIKFGH